jgi:hypothetical protein
MNEPGLDPTMGASSNWLRRWPIIAAVAGVIVVGLIIWLALDRRTVTAPSTSTGSTATSNTETGKVLAGSVATYSQFTEAGYNKAKKDGKIIFLKFYGDWSAISTKVDEPVLEAGFNQLSDKKVVGFRVHFADGKNGSVEDALAKEFNVKTEGTKVIVKDGKAVVTSADSWTAEQFTQEINKAL